MTLCLNGYSHDEFVYHAHLMVKVYKNLHLYMAHDTETDMAFGINILPGLLK